MPIYTCYISYIVFIYIHKHTHTHILYIYILYVSMWTPRIYADDLHRGCSRRYICSYLDLFFRETRVRENVTVYYVRFFMSQMPRQRRLWSHVRRPIDGSGVFIFFEFGARGSLLHHGKTYHSILAQTFLLTVQFQSK